jgi:predicted phage terminase large subunit-like protein
MAETVSIRPQPGAQEAFLSSTADITIYGGAAGGGKSYALLLEPLRHIQNPHFGALVLRKTTPEITNVGGLWTEAENLYPLVGGEPRIASLRWDFPSGARVKFDHLEHEKSKHKYQGSQIPLICFDELTHFTEGQFWYMVSRNRSTCGVRPYIRGTCNPDASSWVAKMVEWWINHDTGYPLPERSGVVRWFVRHGGDLQWSDSAEKLREDYPHLDPKSLTFIPATLQDNPALVERDPGYLANLQALPFVERERLLMGNWNVVDAEGAEWPAEWFNNIYVNDWPRDRLITVVALDPSLGKIDMATETREGDYSAFVAVAKGHDNRYYVDANIAKRNVRHIVDEGIEWMRYIKPDAFGCEFTGFQAIMGELFTPHLEKIWLTGVFPIHTRESLGTLRSMPKKEVRIRTKLTQPLADGRIKMLRSPGTSLLLEQMRAFPIHKHDDGPDALEMAIRLCEELLSGSGFEEREEVLMT